MKKPSKFKFTNAMRELKDYKRKLMLTGGDALKVNLVWWSREICGIDKFVVMTGHSDYFLANKLKTEILL